ncbi:MAG: trypsin-like peptidase domain-containing protein [Bacteroidia bacterium]|nr:trypsin-like peptidase domain-containing protein [Bacteroidia bacterium]
MKKTTLLIIVAMSIILTGCEMLEIGYFETNPAIFYDGKPLEQSINISFRMAVEDSFVIEPVGFPKTSINHYRKSLASAFRNTFRGTFERITWISGISSEGLSIVVSKATPNWYNKGESSQGQMVGCEINYEAIIYVDGKMIRTIQANTHGLVYRAFTNVNSVDKISGAIEVIRDAVAVMCQEIYKNLVDDLPSGGVAFGTGFVISDNGYIVTNAHVVEGAISIKVKGINGDYSTKHKAVIVAEDNVNDLALLKLENIKVDSIPYQIRFKGIETGESVFILGYPLIPTMGEEIKLTTGIVSSKSGFQGSNSSYQVSAPTQPGNSGSPLFDNAGNIIGIINAKHRNTEGVTYAIKPTLIRSMFENNDLELVIPAKNKLSGLGLVDKTKQLTPYIYIIEVER